MLKQAMIEPLDPFLDILTRRLDGAGSLGVAVSGGGDSLALLYRLAEWGRRPLHVFCVDHGLNPSSPAWTQAVADHARRVGAAFTPLHWVGAKPASGLSAAARGARHALLAEAAREAGVRVLCLAHTQDDVQEAAWMRGQGSNVTAPAEWSPSPAWPQGRGVFLLRPLLQHSREGLRDELRSRGITWIDDPANANPQSLRVQARLAEKETTPVFEGATVSRAELEGLLDTQWTPHGVIALRQPAFADLSQRLARKVLAAAAVCAGGGDRLPRNDSVDEVMAGLASGKPKTLCGARIWQGDDLVFVAREAGDIGRNRPERLDLCPGVEAMWDGRYAVRAGRSGSLAPSGVVRDRLNAVDRAVLQRLPVAIRGILPVLDENFPDLDLPNTRLLRQTTQTGVNCANWVVSRFLAACGVIDRESAIGLDLAERQWTV